MPEDIRYLTAMASIKLVEDAALIDLTEEDLEFLQSDKPWMNTERSRARRCIEAATYGALDYLGYPRFAVPAEFVAGTIAYFTSAVNVQTACLIMEGAEWTENIVQGVERPLSASELFAHTLRVRAGYTAHVVSAQNDAEEKITQGII